MMTRAQQETRAILRDWKDNRITMAQAVSRLAAYNIDGWTLLPRI